MSNEIILIIKSLRWLINQSANPLLPTDLKQINWSDFLLLARSQRVLGFVAYAIEQNHLLPTLSSDIQNALIFGILDTQQQNQYKLNQFREASLIFEKSGIDFCPLKGIGLCFRLYQKLPFRTMGDIDLLVREKDISAIKNILTLKGFISKVVITKNRWHDELRGLTQVPFGQMPGGRQSLEIFGLDLDFHWKPAYVVGKRGVSLDVNLAWENARQNSEHSKNTYYLSDEDLLWHLILHTAEVGGSFYLSQLFDIALFLENCSSRVHTNIENRMMLLKNEPQGVLRNLLIDIKILFFGDLTDLKTMNSVKSAIDFYIYRIESPRYTRSRHTLSAGKLSWPKQIKYFVGYFLPNPEYYQLRLGKKGVSMYTTHWLALARKLLAAIKLVLLKQQRAVTTMIGKSFKV